MVHVGVTQRQRFLLFARGNLQHTELFPLPRLPGVFNREENSGILDTNPLEFRGCRAQNEKSTKQGWGHFTLEQTEEAAWKRRHSLR